MAGEQARNVQVRPSVDEMEIAGTHAHTHTHNMNCIIVSVVVFTIFLLNCMYNVWIFYPPYMQFKRQVTYYITKIAPHLLTK